MSVSLLAIIVDCHDPRRQAEWWAQVLAYKVNQRNPDEFEVSDPAGAGRSLYFMKVPEPKVGKNRLHLDLVTAGSMGAEVARLAEAGAQVVEVRQDPDSFDNPDTWTVMRDPEGNEFCVTSICSLDRQRRYSAAFPMPALAATRVHGQLAVATLPELVVERGHDRVGFVRLERGCAGWLARSRHSPSASCGDHGPEGAQR